MNNALSGETVKKHMSGRRGVPRFKHNISQEKAL
jgi:hypothetical protein